MAANAMYRSADWQALRQLTFQRDRWTCKACGILCRGSGRDNRNGAICDHIKPHKGDPALFFDPDNLQTLCKSCHDGAKQSIEKRGFDRQIGLDGWPTDAAHPANKGRV